jgi:hypothetical protein
MPPFKATTYLLRVHNYLGHFWLTYRTGTYQVTVPVHEVPKVPAFPRWCRLPPSRYLTFISP